MRMVLVWFSSLFRQHSETIPGVTSQIHTLVHDRRKVSALILMYNSDGIGTTQFFVYRSQISCLRVSPVM